MKFFETGSSAEGYFALFALKFGLNLNFMLFLMY